MSDYSKHQPEHVQHSPESPFNPYQASQTEQFQVPQGLPSWLVKSWLNTKQIIEEPTPPVETWSGAFGQIYRWFVLFHVCNLLPILTAWKICHRWRIGVLVIVLGLLLATGIAIAVATVFVFVTEHVTWTIR